MIELIGKVKDVSRGMDGRVRLLFEAQSDFLDEAYTLLGEDVLTLKIAKYKARRSLDANSYYWVTLTKLARLLKTSNAELHNLMLSRYGQPWIVGEALHLAMLPDDDETEALVKKSVEYHLRPTSQVKEMKEGKMYRTYITMRGSSTYNTEEMATLIDGLVSECKEAGMTDAEIMSTEEKRILKERYGIKYGS